MAKKKESNTIVCVCKTGSVIARNAAGALDCTCRLEEFFSGEKTEIKNVESVTITGKFPKVKFVRNNG